MVYPPTHPFQSITVQEPEEDLANFITYNVYTLVNGEASSKEGTRSIKIEDGETVQWLKPNLGILEGSPETIHKQLPDGAVNYQVPAGKTAKLVCIIQGLAADAQLKIRGSVTADTADGNVYATYSGSDLDGTRLITFDDITLAANEFLTIEVTSAGDDVKFIWGFVIESV